MGIYSKTHSRSKKNEKYMNKVAINLGKLENLLRECKNKKYIPDNSKIKESQQNEFYNIKDPEVILKQWIRKYKYNLKEHHNYTAYDIPKN